MKPTIAITSCNVERIYYRFFYFVEFFGSKIINHGQQRKTEEKKKKKNEKKKKIERVKNCLKSLPSILIWRKIPWPVEGNRIL